MQAPVRPCPFPVASAASRHAAFPNSASPNPREWSARGGRVAFGAAALVAAAWAAPAAAQVTVRVDLGPGGVQANSDNYEWTAISADGRWVAYASNATNLVPGGTNGFMHVFVSDRLTGTTEHVSVATGGAQANLDSPSLCSVSADGRFVAFGSNATNLVAGDTNGLMDVFVRDRLAGTTERVSVATGGAQGLDASSHPSISGDGRYVAFRSNADNLVAGDTNGGSDVFVRDRTGGTTERVSVATGGAQAPFGFSDQPSISADGRYVAFRSGADFVVGDTNLFADIYLRDRLAGTTERVSVSTGGLEPNFFGSFPSISADGSCVAWMSVASNLVPGDTNGLLDVFVRDRLAGTTERVSVATGGAQGNSDSSYPTLSADGRYVAFHTFATNLVAGDTNGYSDACVRDRLAGTTERISVATSGAQGTNASGGGAISADARFVAFWSYAPNLVAGDTNGLRDFFVRDRGSQASVQFCFGDGSGTACPCGLNGTTGNGCANSINASGGHLASSGSPSVGADTLALFGSGMPNGGALYFQGTANVNGGLGAAFGDGLRCAGGAIIRLGIEFNAAGASSYPGVGEPTVSVRGLVAAGNTRTYQVWYRDADVSFCMPETFNLSNGLSVTWSP